MKYGALTIDTSIFDSHGLKLETGLLKKLEQFKTGDYPLLISEIIKCELESHIEKKVRDGRLKIKKALKEAAEQLTVSLSDVADCNNILISVEPDGDLAKRRVAEFIDKTGSLVVKYEFGLDPRTIIDDYFSGNAPFSKTGSKKNEFPDAFALMNLASWAEARQTKIIAVSSDHDWKRFAEDSVYIDVVDDLSLAISFFQKHHAAIAYCSFLRQSLPKSPPITLVKAIDNALSNEVPELDFTPKIASDHYYEMDILEIFYKKYVINEIVGEGAEVRLIESDDEHLVIEIGVTIYVEAHCGYELFVHDFVDRDYVSLGNSSAYAETNFYTRLLITLIGDYESSPEDIQVDLVEITEYPSYIDFGEVDFDWGHDA